MEPVKITTGGKEYGDNAIKLYGRAFRDDPVITYMLCNLSDEQRLQYLAPWFSTLVTAATLNQGKIEEANDWQAATVWMPPGKKVDAWGSLIPSGFLNVLWNLGIKGCKRMLIEFQSQANVAKKRALKGRKCHYLFIIATEEEHRGKGLGTAFIKRQQDYVLKNDPLPMWLESTTPESMRLYAKCGFEVVEEISIGKGIAGADGKRKEGGEGVKIWAMIWEPKAESSA